MTQVFLEALFSVSCPAPTLPLWRSPSSLLQTPMGFGSCLLRKDGNSEAVKVFFPKFPVVTEHFSQKAGGAANILTSRQGLWELWVHISAKCSIPRCMPTVCMSYIVANW